MLSWFSKSLDLVADFQLLLGFPRKPRKAWETKKKPVYGHMITNFLGWVDLLTHGALLVDINSV